MKYFQVKSENMSEIRDWCIENIGPETVRWWFDSEVLFALERYPSHRFGCILTIDITEEEEAVLTAFIMTYG